MRAVLSATDMIRCDVRKDVPVGIQHLLQTILNLVHLGVVTGGSYLLKLITREPHKLR